jgi:hypothetical protein
MLREGAGKPATRSRACGLCPKANCKTSPWHKKDQRTAPGERKIGNPYSLLTIGYSLKSFSNNVRFADLVVMAERLHPIPFRTRP